MDPNPTPFVQQQDDEPAETEAVRNIYVRVVDEGDEPAEKRKTLPAKVAAQPKRKVRI